MDDTYKKQRKTNRLLSRKKEERERRIQEIKTVNMKHLDREKQKYEKETSKVLDSGDEKSRRSLKLYEKLFAQTDEPVPHIMDGRSGKPDRGYRQDRVHHGDTVKEEVIENEEVDDRDAPPAQREWIPTEEFMKLKQEKERKYNEKRKFKSLYGRKTSKGQPIMKHRVNHLLAKIKSGASILK